MRGWRAGKTLTLLAIQPPAHACYLRQVWNAEGTLIGKFFLGTLSANLVFAGDGRLVIMAETAVYLAEIAAKANKVSFP